MNEYYYYGVAAMFYITTCWTFVAVRWFHTCQEPKERRAYIWPDRKLQCLVYSMATLLMPYVFNRYEILDDGPLRFTVHLVQNKTRVDGCDIEEHRIIQLDKQSNFNRMTVWYEGLDHAVSFCSGVVIQREDPDPVVLGPNYVYYTDPTDQPRVHQAPLYVAALFPNGTVETRRHRGHALGILSDYRGDRYTYYFGSAWSKYDVRTPQEWQARIEWFLRGLDAPLQVSVR